MGGFRTLIVWQRAMDLLEKVYRRTATYPSEEKFGLTSQMRRAAVSIVANIAEGRGRRTPQEYVHFVGNARGSCLELQAHVLISERLGFLDAPSAAQLIADAEEVGRLLNGLLTYLRRPSGPPPPKP